MRNGTYSRYVNKNSHVEAIKSFELSSHLKKEISLSTDLFSRPFPLAEIKSSLLPCAKNFLLATKCEADFQYMLNVAKISPAWILS